MADHLATVSAITAQLHTCVLANLALADGDVYEGNFMCGGAYEGSFQHWLPHGQSATTYTDGRVREDQFDRGTRVA